METVESRTLTPAVLGETVERLADGRGEATVRRYRRVFAHLMLFLDHVDVRGPLGLEAAAVLEAERDVGREGAFLRRFGAAELVRCLPLYLDDAWLAVRRRERSAQLRVVEAVARYARDVGAPAASVRTVRDRVAVVRSS